MHLLNHHEYEPLIKKKERKATPLYILIPSFFLSFGYCFVDIGCIQFYTNIVCELKKDEYPNLTNCNVPEIQATVSRIQALIGFSSSICCILTAGFYGSLADRYGRRLIFQLNCIGSIIHMIGYIILSKLNLRGLNDNYLIWIMLVGIPTIKNLLVGDGVIMNFFQVYIADTTTTETRVTAFGHMMGSMLSAITIGSFSAGMIMKKTGSVESVFYIRGILIILFLLYVIFILPESLDKLRMKKNQQEYQEKPKTNLFEKINLFSSIGSLLLNDKKNTKGSKYKMTNYTIFILVISRCILTMNYLLPTLLYGMLVFHWTTYEGGITHSIGAMIRLTMVMVVFPFIVKKYQAYSHQSLPSKKDKEQNEHYIIYRNILLNVWLIRISFITACISYILIALASNTATYIFIQCILSIDTLAQPSLRTLFTSLIDPSLIGTLSGIQSQVDSISHLIGEVGINLIYSASVKTTPNLIFYIFAIITGFTTLLTFLMNPIKQNTL